MATSKTAGERVHDAMHQLPGMPGHDRAAELNSNATAARRHPHALANHDRHHGRPPRVFVRWQAWIGRLFGQPDR